MVYVVFVVCIKFTIHRKRQNYIAKIIKKEEKNYRREKNGENTKKYFLRRVLSQAENCGKEIKGWLITCPEEIRNFDVYFKLSSCVCWQFIVRKFLFFVFYFSKNRRECNVDPEFWNGCQAMKEQLFRNNLRAKGHSFQTFVESRDQKVVVDCWCWWWG